ncbi:MAG: hypothetical protein ACLR56_04170 [Oscillospiraceae bacterium]
MIKSTNAAGIAKNSAAFKLHCHGVLYAAAEFTILIILPLRHRYVKKYI